MLRTRNRTIHACAVALLALVASTALADESAREAKEAFARASELFQQRDYATALTAFRRAYELRPHHAVLCSMARCHEHLGRPLEAAAHYERCLQEGGRATRLAARIERALDEVRRRVAHVQIRSSVSSALIYVNGRRVGRPPRRVALNPGQHTAELRRGARRLAESEFVLAPGDERTLELTPAPQPSVASATQPAATQPLPAAPRRHLRSGWFWGAVGTTLAFAGATAVLGVLTLRKRNDYDDAQTTENEDSFYLYRMLTNVFVGLTSAAAGSALVLYFFTDFGARERPAGVAGFGLHGTF